MTGTRSAIAVPRTYVRLVSVVAGAALVGAALSGCTGDDRKSPTASGSTSSSATGSASATLTDRSSQLLGAAGRPTVAVTTKAKPSSSFRGSTFEIYSLVRTDTSTVLTFSVTAGDSSSSSSDQVAGQWVKYPVLSTGQRKYLVVTYEKDPGESDPWAAVSNPTLGIKPGQRTAPQTILYPALPAGTTSVSVSSDWFDTVKVPVTSAGA